jgi:hypothetical protein
MSRKNKIAMSKKQSSGKAPEKVKPDDGQGSEGQFGSDGDWGRSKKKDTEKEKSSPVPVKRNND